MDPFDPTATEFNVPLDGYAIRDLTLEAETGCLYWASILNIHYVIITKRCPGNQSNIPVHTTRASLTGLTVTMVTGRSLVFWYDVDQEVVLLLDGMQEKVYQEWSSGGAKVVGLLAHTTAPGKRLSYTHT